MTTTEPKASTEPAAPIEAEESETLNPEPKFSVDNESETSSDQPEPTGKSEDFFEHVIEAFSSNTIIYHYRLQAHAW